MVPQNAEQMIEALKASIEATKRSPDGRFYFCGEGSGHGFSKEHFAVRETEGGRVCARFNTATEAKAYALWLGAKGGAR